MTSTFIAPIALGTILNWTLYGVLITQFYIYTYSFPDDGRCFKYLAYGIVFLETVQSGLALADLFHLIDSMNIVSVDDEYLGDYLNYIISPLSPFGGPILVGALAAVVVQSFFVYRIWVLGNKKSWWLCLTILFFSAVTGISEIIGSLNFQVGGAFGVERSILWAVCTLSWLFGSVVTDVIITISLLYLLKRECNEGTSPSTKNAISKIVRLTVETNLLTTTVAIIALVSFGVLFAVGVITPLLDWTYCPIAVIGKLYANSLLASLNNRIAIRQDSGTNASIRIPDATLPRPPSVMIFTPSKEGNRRSRECGEDGSLVIDIA